MPDGALGDLLQPLCPFGRRRNEGSRFLTQLGGVSSWESAMKIVSLFLLTLLGVVPSWAVLGELEPSVTADQQRLNGELRSTTEQGYTVHEIAAPDGMIVKEYVAPGGRVFGVSWRGPAMPRLQDLLGSYFAEFQQSATSAAGTHHRALSVRTDRLVVESSGHMRAFRGRAYVPSLVPANVAEEVVQ
jgi:hypothetical protein